jgi:hypothetical protein
MHFDANLLARSEEDGWLIFATGPNTVPARLSEVSDGTEACDAVGGALRPQNVVTGGAGEAAGIHRGQAGAPPNLP